MVEPLVLSSLLFVFLFCLGFILLFLMSDIPKEWNFILLFKKNFFRKGDFESGFQSALNLLGIFSSGVTGFSSENVFAM